MTSSADELVTEFCKKWATPDPEELAGYFTEDAVYHNIPMEPVQGREAIEQFIAGFTAVFDGIDFQVHKQVCDGDLVINERTDVMRRKDGDPIALPALSARPAAAPTGCGCR
jgi:limonene-1,2-epoxide hydrolase